VRPEDAWTGLAPHNAANDASEVRRWGVVTGCDQEGGGGFGTDPRSGQQRRVGPGAELIDLGGECLVAAGQDPQGFFGVGDGGV